ncbi:HIT family hydrolase [Halobacteriales archaeon QS_9_68_42]|nr:MAG: HIT family hydrolase [Halobacteriales archaeon QS_9_68_42]
MDQLFAPWRIEWVERDGNEDIDGCPFCALPEREDARDALVVAESAHAYVLLNNYPYNPGHAMVIPREHTGAFEALDEETLLDHALLKQRTIEAFDAALAPDGVNAGLNLGDASGGSIDDHLHTHLVPRWAGDTNFMPVCADTKVVVQAVDDTYEKLHAAFADQEGATVGDDGAVRLKF